MTAPTNISSPRGPRRGFYWQDLFATRELVRCALEHDTGIDGINVEANNAGHADDVVIHRGDHRTYVQLKHSVDSHGHYVASDLFGKSDGKSSVFAKLFITWQAVKDQGPFEIQLHTNQSASTTSKKCSITPFDLETRLLSPLRTDASFQPPDDLNGVLDDLQAKAGAASRQELVDFLSHLRLVFDAPGADTLENEVVSLISDRFYMPHDKATNVAYALFGRVYGIATDAVHGANPLLRKEILALVRRCAGMECRRVGHSLDLPDNHLPRDAFAQEVLSQIEATESGYILITGVPGCGKTTFTTWLAETHPDKVLLRYHAFHPRALSGVERQRRLSHLGLAEELLGALHDRFPLDVRQRFPNRDELHKAAETLGAELTKLGQQKKWVLIVDGLDHVIRSSVAESESIFAFLPPKPPPNIVFVLFGQPGWHYPGRLVAEAKQCTFPLLSEQECWELVQPRFRSETSTDLEVFASRLHVRSGGNPLSVYYTLEALAGLSLTEATERMDHVRIGPDLNAFYRELRDGLEVQLQKRMVGSSTLLPELFAFFALATLSITPERLALAFPDDFADRTARDTLEAMRPVLVAEGERGYRLFHDDFRRFVEQDLDDKTRRVTHARHAQALGTTATGNEHAHLAEHLWLAGDDAALRDLPFSRSLAEWLSTCHADALITIHRLALAAALRLTDTHRAIRISLALRRLNELDPGQNEEHRHSLRDWLGKVLPAEVGHRATEVRHAAIDTACREFSRDPDGARRLVERVIRSTPREGIGELEFHLINWWLWSADLDRVESVAARYGNLGPTHELVTSYATVTDDLVQLRTTVERLAHLGRWWGTGFSRVALDALLGSDTARARALLDGLVSHHSELDDVTARLVAFLSHLHGRPVPVSPAVRRATVTQNIPDTYPDLDRMTLGWAMARYGAATELDAIVLPSQLRSSRDHWMPRFSEWLFRVGALIGLFHRNPQLVTPKHLKDLWAETQPRNRGYHEGKWRREGRVQMAILVAMTVRTDTRLRPALLGLLEPEVARARVHPEQEDTHLFDALWFLDEARWRSIAIEVTSGPLPSFHDAYLRDQWCNHWLTRAATRGLTLPDAFHKVAHIARLGIPRKTNPSDLALTAFEKLPWTPALAETVAEFCDLQLSAAHYSEATRYTAFNLAPVLALALAHDPALFESLYRHVMTGLRVDVSDTLPTRIATAFLAGGVSAIETRDIEALWWWVCACPDSFEGEGRGRALADQVAALHQTRGESQLQNTVLAWTRARLRSTDAPEKDDSQAAAEDDELDAPDPDLSAVEPEWFNLEFSPEQVERRKPFIRKHYAAVMAMLAEGVAQEKWRLYELHPLAEGLAEVAPDVDWAQVLRLALDDLRERVALLPEPSSSTTTGHAERVSALLSVMLDGLDSQDTLTIESTLRSAAAAARSPRLSDALQRLLVPRLRASEDRTVEWALALVPHVVRRQPGLDEALVGLTSHPHAGVRAMVSQHLGTRATWNTAEDTAPLLTMPTLVAEAAPEPDTMLPGMAFFGEADSVLKKIASAMARFFGDDADKHLGSMKAILAMLPAPSVPRHAPPQRAGHFFLSAHRAHDAALRYLSRIARDLAPDALHQCLSYLAPFDPWVVTAPPGSELRPGQLSLCSFEQDWYTSAVDAGRLEAEWRVLALVPSKVTLSTAAIEAAFDGIVRTSDLPSFVTSLGPTADWTGRAHQGVLAFAPPSLTSLPSGAMELVPRWDHPLLSGLGYRVGVSPSWFDAKGEAVVTPYRKEARLDRQGRGMRQVVCGWGVEKRHLANYVSQHPELRLVELSRRETQGRVTYGAFEVTLDFAGNPKEGGA